MRAKEYDLMRRAVEDGVAYGWRRAHKYNEAPDERAICDAMEEAVVNALCEWFTFDDIPAEVDE